MPLCSVLPVLLISSIYNRFVTAIGTFKNNDGYKTAKNTSIKNMYFKLKYTFVHSLHNWKSSHNWICHKNLHSSAVCNNHVTKLQKLMWSCVHQKRQKGKGKVVFVVFLKWVPCHEGILGQWMYASLTSALDGGEWSASCPGCFTHRIGGWVSPRASLDMVMRRKIPSPY